MSWESLVSAALPALIVGIVLALWEARMRHKETQKRQAEDAQVESDLMRIDLEVATAQLAYAVAMAYKRGTPNGEMEIAIATYERAMEKFRKFERKQVALNNRD